MTLTVTREHPEPSTANAGRRRGVLLLVATFVAAFLVGFGVQPALAGSASSSNGTFTVAGKTYSNYATVNTNNSVHWAWARTTTQRGGAPSGDMGSRGRLFTGNGSLSCEGNITYNSGVTYANGDSCTRDGVVGDWYSYGVSYGWNGSGYNAVYTFQSPHQNS